MVDEPDLQQARSFVEAPGDDLVSTTRARVAGWMVVHQGESVGRRHDYWAEDLSWQAMAFAHRAEADPVPGVGAEPGVHHHDHHALLVWFVVWLGGDNFLPELQQVLRCVGGDGAGIFSYAGDGDAAGSAWLVSW